MSQVQSQTVNGTQATVEFGLGPHADQIRLTVQPNGPVMLTAEEYKAWRQKNSKFNELPPLAPPGLTTANTLGLATFLGGAVATMDQMVVDLEVLAQVLERAAGPVGLALTTLSLKGDTYQPEKQENKPKPPPTPPFPPFVPPPSGGKVAGQADDPCGESGPYGKLPKNDGFQNDHVPSQGALRTSARRMLNLKEGQKLDPCIRNKIESQGEAISTPTEIHAKASQTWRGRNTTTRQNYDADDLQRATQENTDAILKAMQEADIDPNCIEKYKESADRLKKKTQQDYKDWLKKIISDCNQRG